MDWFVVALVLPGFVAAYFMFIRPVLSAMPTLKGFYAEADGFWQKVWAVCGKSLTNLWSGVLAIVGGVFSQLDNIATTLGDPNFKQQVTDLIGADPKALGYFAMVVSAVTIAARLRSIAKA
jgi:hypothetical protein